MRLLQLYLGLVRAEVQAAAAYRLQLLFGVLGFASPLAFLALWRGSAQGGPVAGIAPSALAAYFALVLLTNSLQITLPVIFDLGWDVYTGQLSAHLLRPAHPIHRKVASGLAGNLYRLPMLALVVPVVLLATGATVRAEASVWLLALGVAGLGWVAMVHLAALSAAVAFWMSKAQGVQGLVVAAEWVLGGVVAPAVLLPGPVAALAVHLPFWFAIGAGPALAAGVVEPRPVMLLEAAAWCLALHLAYRAVWRRAVRRYEAVGT